MANVTLPFRYGTGRGVQMWRDLATGKVPWPHGPRFSWGVTLDRTNIYGAGTTQVDTITIPASGFVSGSLTLTFSGDALASPVDVVAYAAVGDANTDLATALEAAIASARAGDLSGVVANETVLSDEVFIVFAPGIGRVTVTTTWRSAQQTTVQLAGTIYDAIYRLTLTGGGLVSPVEIDTARSAGTPAAISDMVVQREADAEGLIATTLADVLVSADDDGADLNTFVFEPDVSDVTITPSIVLDTEAMSQTVDDVTPAGPTVTTATVLTVDLNSIATQDGIPANALRSWCRVTVIEAFGAGRTLTVGDESDLAGYAGTTPIDLDTPGRTGSDPADAYYQPFPEAANTPLATIDLGADSEVTDGSVLIEILFHPNLADE